MRVSSHPGDARDFRPDQLAVLRHANDSVAFGYRADGDDRPVSFRRLDVDASLAASTLWACRTILGADEEILQVRSFAITVLRDGQQIIAGIAADQPDELVVRADLDSP